MTKQALFNIVARYTANGKSVRLNVSRGDGFEAINGAQQVFTADDDPIAFKPFIRLLYKFLYVRLDYINEAPIYIQIVELPDENPPLQEFRDGSYNCACEPVLEYLQSLKPTDKTKRTIKRVNALNDKYFESGIDDEGLTQLAKTSQVNIVALDASKAVWAKYDADNNKRKTIILYAHNKHFKQVLSADTETAISFNPFNKVNKDNIEWLPYNYNWCESDLNRRNIDSSRLVSKGRQVALITPTKIYKTQFYQSKEYPDCFTDGGVGKAKFIEQVPMMKAGIKPSDPFYQIYFDADVSGFYCQNSPSCEYNLKLDHNHSYKSFSKSPAQFKGFPVLDALFSINKPVSDSVELFQYSGLLYIETPQIKPSKLGLNFRLSYEGSGWYPVEIVQYYYTKYGINPFIKAFAHATTTFDVDFSEFSNSQFRCFIGKTATKHSTETWRTTDKYEYLRALYTLQDKVIGVTTFKQYDQKVREVEFKNDKTPWQCPVISAYVKAHQKVILFDQYNKLIDNNITPVCVRVDGIEIKASKDSRQEVLNLFDIGTAEGQWKIEPVKNAFISYFDDLHYMGREPATLSAYSNLIPFNPELILPRLTHFAGAGGNGKTTKLIELKKVYPNLCVSAPTHDAADVLSKKGIAKVDTYHRIFGIGCPSNIPEGCDKFAIDECSMIPSEHLVEIDTTLRQHFNRPDVSFGGAQIILSGDFWQLPPVSPLVVLHNTWTGIKTELYKQFEVIELTKNWRQENDSNFFGLCQLIRMKLTKQQAYSIIDKLNTRVLNLPNYDTLDDMYIAGKNDQCDTINNKYTLTAGTKVICNKTCKDLSGKKVANGKVGVILKNETNDFQVEWGDNSISKFRSAGQVAKGKGASRFKIAIALTVHKSQGKTLKGNVVINPSRLFERNHLYVALTRATCFNNIYLTEPITFRQFFKTVYVSSYSGEGATPVSRLERMATKYQPEEPRLTSKLLSEMRVKQCNQCYYCSIAMTDTYGYNDSITLERLDDDKKHTLDNIVLACSKCNSAHIKK
jgi:hypothetical protein